MRWKISFSKEADKTIAKFDKVTRERISEFVNNILPTMENPRSLGKPLHPGFSGFWRYTVGNYRVIVDIQDKDIVIVVVDVGHRSKIYKSH